MNQLVEILELDEPILSNIVFFSILRFLFDLFSLKMLWGIANDPWPFWMAVRATVASVLAHVRVCLALPDVLERSLLLISTLDAP